MTFLPALLEHDIVPVIPRCDGEGRPTVQFRCVAVEVAKAMKAAKLIYLWSQPEALSGEPLRQLAPTRPVS